MIIKIFLFLLLLFVFFVLFTRSIYVPTPSIKKAIILTIKGTIEFIRDLFIVFLFVFALIVILWL